MVAVALPIVTVVAHVPVVPDVNLPAVAPPTRDVSEQPALDVKVVPWDSNPEAAIAFTPAAPTNKANEVVRAGQVAEEQPMLPDPEVLPPNSAEPVPNPTPPTAKVPVPLSTTSALAATVVEPPAEAYRATAPAVPLFALTVPEPPPTEVHVKLWQVYIVPVETTICARTPFTQVPDGAVATYCTP